MRAWFYTKYGGPSVLQMGELPDAELRGPSDVVVQVYAAALNPLDYKRRQGVLKPLLTSNWPHVIGYDFSGVVVACGERASKFRVGDQVFGMVPHDSDGSMTDFVSIDECFLAKKPSNLSHVEAASLPMVSLTALQAFRSGHLADGKKVLVTGGAGGVGTVAIQIAKSVFKARIVATTASTKKIERMKALGANEVVDYTREVFERELAEYDFALDCTAEAKRCFDCVTRNGSVISIAETPTWRSIPSGPDTQGVSVNWFVGFALDCLSSPVVRKARQARIAYDYLFMATATGAMDEVRQLCEDGKLAPVVDKVFPFERADTAMEYLEAGHATGKVVVEFAPLANAYAARQAM